MPYNPPLRALQSFFVSYIPPLRGEAGGGLLINYFPYRWRLLLSLLSANLPLTPSLRGNHALQRYFYKNKTPACVLHSPSSREVRESGVCEGGRLIISLIGGGYYYRFFLKTSP